MSWEFPSLHVAVTTVNSNKTISCSLFIVTEQHTTLATILPRMYYVMQCLLHEEAPDILGTSWKCPFLRR